MAISLRSPSTVNITTNYLKMLIIITHPNYTPTYAFQSIKVANYRKFLPVHVLKLHAFVK